MAAARQVIYSAVRLPAAVWYDWARSLGNNLRNSQWPSRTSETQLHALLLPIQEEMSGRRIGSGGLQTYANQPKRGR
jgi:hypothetical protein